jgi:hypothetical protein
MTWLIYLLVLVNVGGSLRVAKDDHVKEEFVNNTDSYILLPFLNIYDQFHCSFQSQGRRLYLADSMACMVYIATLNTHLSLFHGPSPPKKLLDPETGSTVDSLCLK